MAEVWQGIHVQQGMPVALKILTGSAVQAPAFQAALRNELRAVAGLCHPNVVMVFDYGEVSAAASVASQGLLTAGSPWLAMEFASGGSLRELRGRMSWGELRGTLLALLSALSHAHARGVIHRDIKPANTLRCVSGDLRPGIKLTDFGLAYAAEWPGSPSPTAGTPAYMAPEQRQGRVRDYGPWTDLYSLGRTAVALLTGSPGGDALPPARVPKGFLPWLSRLLQPEPIDRFQRAADAAYALRRLDSAVSWVDVPLSEVLPGPSSTAQETWLETRLDGIPEVAPARPDIVPVDIHRPPHPPAWPTTTTTPLSLAGAGLRLAPLRQPPLIGRTTQQAALWRQLAEVRQRSRPVAVVLEGAAGVGKSHLAAWLLESAAATGTAETFNTAHAPGAGGLSGMLAQRLRCEGLPEGRLLSRVEALLRPLGITTPDEWRAIAALISSEIPVKFTSAAERHHLLARVILALSRGGPALLWLDDVQWGGDALMFARHVLTQLPDQPLMIVLTAQTEALAERPFESRQLDRLLALPDTHRSILPALTDPDTRQLVRELLGMDGALTDGIVSRCGGNPLFAVQLIRDWVAREVLVPGEDGFRLAAGAQVPLPDSLHTIWSARLDRLCVETAWRSALELASVLGAEVSRSEWVAVCAGLGLSEAGVGALLEALLEQRLAVASDPRKSFSFAHGMLRESLLRAAEEAERLPDRHRQCAAMLAEMGGSVERIGLHRLSAGDAAEALPGLLEGAERQRLRGDHKRAQWLLEQREAAAESLGLSWDDPQWMEGWICAARVSLVRGKPEQAAVWATRVETASRSASHPAALSEAFQILGRLAHASGQVAEAADRLETAVILARASGRVELEAAALRLLAGLHIAGGRLDDAERCHQDALALLGEGDSPREVGMCRYALAGIAIRRGEHAVARAYAEEAWRCYERAGYRGGAASSLNLMGEAARAAGDLDDAERCYREALQRAEHLGSWTARLPAANLGLLLITRQRFEDGRALLEQGIAALEKQGMGNWAIRLRICLLPCEVWAGDQGSAAARLREAEGLAVGGERVSEFVRVAGIAAELCRDQGWTDLLPRVQAAREAHSVGSTA
ncbi:MAG: serine/threonine protein kinase/tetratricopeptide (TPR) repeat protein [Myxococcota bacterium]|jgi:serine/threonine protein kinase/tetratricopeptide (TPR) repeat protein